LLVQTVCVPGGLLVIWYEFTLLGNKYTQLRSRKFRARWDAWMPAIRDFGRG
jgi:hypothetical protein